MQEQVLSWISAQCGASMKVEAWCEDPEMNKGGLLTKSYLTYRMLLKRTGSDLIGVRHRYSEFEAVRKALKDRYYPLGIVVPQLPAKKMLGSRDQESAFVKERTQGLSLFTREVVSNPFLFNDSDWKEFMRSPSSSYSDSDGGENVGEKMLTEALRLLEPPFKFTMSTRMDGFRDELNAIEQQVVNLVKHLRNAQAIEKSLALAQEAINSSMQTWSEAETHRVKSLNGYPFECPDSIVREQERLTTTIACGFRLGLNKSMSRMHAPDYAGALLISALEGELSRIESLRELVKQHDDMVGVMGQIGMRLEKAASGKSKDSIPDLQRQLELKQNELSFYYKGFVYFTLPLCARLRTAVLRKAFSYIGATALAESCHLRSASLNFFRTMEVSPEAAVIETSRVLDQLSLKPLDEALVDYGSDKFYSSFQEREVPVLIGLFECALSGNYSSLTSHEASRLAVAAGISSTQEPSANEQAASKLAASTRFSDEESDGGLGPEAAFASLAASSAVSAPVEGAKVSEEVPRQSFTTRDSIPVFSPPQQNQDVAAYISPFAASSSLPTPPSSKQKSLLDDLMGEGEDDKGLSGSKGGVFDD